MLRHQEKALKTINRLSDQLGIPPEALANSRMKVSGAIEEGALIWCEAQHNGRCWELIRETEVICRREGYNPPDKEEFVHLDAPAVQWLIASINRDHTDKTDN